MLGYLACTVNGSVILAVAQAAISATLGFLFRARKKTSSVPVVPYTPKVPRQRTAAARLALANAAISGLLFVGLTAVYVAYNSNLGLAQAADSFSDLFISSALLVSIRIAAKPADENHPFGHQPAEPIAALVAAVFAGVLAMEVARAALESLASDGQPTLAWPIAAAFALKGLVKTGLAMRARRSRQSPALHALFVDARNDALVCLLSLVGFLSARYGWSDLDAWLALPAALWIGASGVELARDNIQMLMGVAPPVERRTELLALCREVPGVQSAHNLRARYHGASLSVWVEIAVADALSLRDAHDIGEAVEQRLLATDDVCTAIVHVDVL